MRIKANPVIFLAAVLVWLAGCNDQGDTTLSATPVAKETPNSFLRFLNDQQGNVYSDEWTQAYYRVVDPDGERLTLEAWKAVNGFGQCDDQIHIIFRDAKDLGYGRDMYACRHEPGSAMFPEGRFAVFVRNFVVRVLPGDPANYGPINVEAAIENDLDHLLGTNAIEFSPIDPTDPSSEKVAKFFTFTPGGALNYRADLDGRGKKPMPQPCLLCHGATLLPWDTDAVIAHDTPWDIPEVAQTLKSAKFNQLELESFDYSALYSLWSRGNQEERFRRFNQHVLDTYIETSSRDDKAPGHWCADFAIELALGRYDPSLSPAAPATACDAYADQSLSGTYQDDFVPRGWKEDPSRPAGVEVLYKRVVEPHCISCHSLRGNAAGVRAQDANPTRIGNAINFASYEDFIGYADVIEDYVYRRGVMPLSVRNYLLFWEDPDVAPAILASFLPGFSHYTAAGKVVAPGKPVALPGGDRVTTSPLTLDASASLFARSYQWSVVDKPIGAITGFGSPNSATTTFAGNRDGDYVVRLTVSNLLGTDTRDIAITLDSSLSPAPAELNFYDHIRPILQQTDGVPGTTKRERCSNCHSSTFAVDGNANRGVPVYYNDAVDDPLDPLDRNLYKDVMARVDLDEPELSLLLRKPIRDQHGGGVVLDLDNSGHRETWETMLAWIRAGAPCDNENGDGQAAGICP